MSVFDYITINLPTFPHSGVLFQTYLDLADSYGDRYQVDMDGRLLRLTASACLSDDAQYRLPAPAPLDYSNPALEAYEDGADGDAAYLLTFVGGTLTAWRRHPDFVPTSKPHPGGYLAGSHNEQKNHNDAK